jgi:hypothetical protein
VTILGLMVGMVMDSVKNLFLDVIVAVARKRRSLAVMVRHSMKIVPLSWGYYRLLPLKFGMDYIAVYEVWSSLKEPAFSYLRARDDMANFLAKITFVLFTFFVAELFQQAYVIASYYTDLAFDPNRAWWLIGLFISMVVFQLIASARLRIAIGITYLLTNKHVKNYECVELPMKCSEGTLEQLEKDIFSAFENIGGKPGE